MAAALRQLVRYSGYLLLALITLLPFAGLVVGLWPQQTLSTESFTHFLASPGLGISVLHSLLAALISTFTAFYLAFIVYSHYGLSAWWQKLERQLAPLLSLPHLALAFGLVYLFGSQSLMADILSSGLPHKSLTTLIVAITLKEVPFFLLVLGSVRRSLPLIEWRRQGQVLGYHHVQIWFLIVLPSMLPHMRLALMAACIYTLSVVDVAMVVGPNVPELFAVKLYQWQTGFTDVEQTMAFWGNGLLILLMLTVVAFIYAQEWTTRRLLRLAAGGRSSLVLMRWLSPLRAVAPALIIINALVLMTFLSQSLRDPEASELSLRWWQEEWLFLQLPLFHTLISAALSAAGGLCLALMALHFQQQRGRYWFDGLWLAAILLPQLSLVYGWQIGHSWLRGDYSMFWVVLAHLPFTFAYAYLVLKDPYRRLPPHFETLAASFGYGPWQRLWRVRLRLLVPAIMVSLALAFSVSVALYIPTLMIGAGRVPTITTEAVALASGNDQAQVAIYMLLQAFLPLFVFLLAVITGQRTRGVFNAQY